MPLQILNIPTSPFFGSRLRLFKGMEKLFNQELIYLAGELEKGQIEQQYYDDSVAAIEHDKNIALAEIQKLTEIRTSTSDQDAA